MDDKKKNFKKKFFTAKIALGQAFFQHQNFEKTPETKKMRNKTFKFSKKLRLLW